MLEIIQNESEDCSLCAECQSLNVRDNKINETTCGTCNNKYCFMCNF